jgi:hypothetical protein
MGFLTAIGSLFGPVGTVVGALADTKIEKDKAKKRNAAMEAAYQRQLEQDRKNRELAKEDASNKFKDLAVSAKKAGINPLTALRATGGAGFGSYGGMTAIAPVLSRFNFATTFATNVGKAYLDYKQNSTIDNYNEQVRNLDLEARQLDIKLGKAKLDNINTPDVYSSYGEYIPVRVGNNTQQLEKTVAIRMRIKPNDMLTVEDLQMIKGDVLSEAEAIAADAVRNQVLIPPPLGGSDSDTWLNNLVGMATNAINSVQGNYDNTPPFSNSGWQNEYRKYVY